VCQGGEGHFLGEQQTLEMMTTEYYYPHIGDRQTREKWRSDGRLNTAARARRRTEQILETHQPQPIRPEIDAAIRERFRILLPFELANPG
jgi:trimethylamine--corrinoid protein Co-methyltransferase